ncbi:MAG: hypothetical protein M0P91_05375 [Sulfuricurvum sp.]|jgi:DNA gyrase/topoisomerase IV subunit A|uniref:hypothetical protein n=1 Tax=Sulfuricurvum sp. TaxID=2025608 RepID=UPI0025EE4542|nr:hypothetical protein [Sulfuricurvum sp.]MCK9372607.1 hypothetical protein [Sulfuricurvum sp.]
MNDLQRETLRSYKKELKKIIKKSKRVLDEIKNELDDDEDSFDHYVGKYIVQTDMRLIIDGVGEMVIVTDDTPDKMATVRVDNDGYYVLMGEDRYELIDAHYMGNRLKNISSINDHCSFIDEFDKDQRAKAFSEKIARIEKNLKKAKKL